MATMTLGKLLTEVRACTACSAALDHDPRPVVQVGTSARIVIIGQAPGRGRDTSSGAGPHRRDAHIVSIERASVTSSTNSARS